MNKKDIPVRLPIGIGRQTIEFPTKDGVFHPDEFDFKRQSENYSKIKEILSRYHLHLELLGVKNNQKQESYLRAFLNKREDKPIGTLTSFVSYAGDPAKPLFVWQKYEGNTPGGGQNYVYVNGSKIKTTRFVCMNDQQLDDLFGAVMLKAWVSQK